VILASAIDISNAGQVIAHAVHAAIIPEIPEPEISALLLAGLALVGFMTRRKNRCGAPFILSYTCRAK
jgi:hypothetical protein